MKIKRVFIKNIRSYQEQEIIFPDGSLLLSGDIGSGKSSILLAIEYALFGLQPGQKGSALLRNNSDFGVVILELEIKGKSVVLEKRLKRSSKGVTNEYSSITIEGIKEESSITEIKTKLLDLLGYPPEFIKKNNLLYRYTVFTPQEQMKQIILEDQEIRLNTIRHIFGIDKYKRIRENLQITINSLKEKAKFLQGEVSDIGEERKNLDLRISFLKDLSGKIPERSEILKEKFLITKNIQSKIDELQSKIDEKNKLETEIEKTRIIIKNKKEYLSNFEKELSEVITDLSNEKSLFDETLYRITLEKIKIKIKEIDDLNSRYINITSDLTSLNKIKEDNLKKRERLFKIDICPTCLQDVSDGHKHNILNDTESTISKIKSKTAELEFDKKIIIDLLNKEKEEYSFLIDEKSRIEILKSRVSEIEKLKARRNELERKIEILMKDTEILENNLKNFIESLSNLSKFYDLIEKNQFLLQEARIEERKAEISLAELKKEIDLLSNEISLLKNKVEEKEIKRKKLSYLIELNDWMSAKFLGLIEFIERNILMNLRMEFSSLFKSWCSSLIPQESLEVHLDESFSPIIIQNEVEMPYEFLSGGERTAVALAYRLALNQTINSVLSKIQTRDLVILDEPTEGFSETQIDKMRDVLQELNVSQLIIVSHEQKMESFVENVIKIRKENDLSVIYEESFSKSKAEPQSLNNINISNE